jgi:magnesium-protoporphyrin IX monomethyl ester (oxidative) cyclase
MTAFKHLALVKAHPFYNIPFPQDLADLTELCYLASAVRDVTEKVSIPVSPDAAAPLEDFDRYLLRNRPDIVGISTMTCSYSNALRFAEKAKRAGAYVVMGGYHPTALTQEVLSSPWVDAVIRGEGELTLRDLILKGPSREVLGLSFKENGSILHIPDRPLVENLDEIVQPWRELRPERFGERGFSYSIDSVYTSRGCKMFCRFCANSIVSGHWRGRSAENVIQELQEIHSSKRRKILKFWDANFMADIGRVERILDLMLEERLTGFDIWTEVRVDDLVRGEYLLEKFKRVGLQYISLGIESPNASTLRWLKKGLRPPTIEKAISILNRYRIRMHGHLILGHLTETEADILRYPEYAREIGIKEPIFMVMTPYPGTEIFDEYEKQGAIRSKDWDLYNNFGVTISPQGISRTRLMELYAYCWGKFYLGRSFRKQGTVLGAFLELLFRFYLAVFLSQEEVKEEGAAEALVMEFLLAAKGEYARDRPYRDHRFLKLFGRSPVLQFKDSKGRIVEFTVDFSATGGKLTVKEGASSSRAFIIPLKSAMGFVKKLPAHKMSELSCNYEVLRNNYGRRKGVIVLRLLLNRNLWNLGGRLLFFLFSLIFRNLYR